MISRFLKLKRPRLVMTLLVRNEGDILEQNIRFHLAQGVDFIVAGDNNSTDKTTDILKEYEKQGVLAFSRIQENTYEQSKWVSAMARVAVEKHKATHLFHCDADEFWFPKVGSLKSRLPKDNEVFVVQRFNSLPSTIDDSNVSTFAHIVVKKENAAELGPIAASERYLFLDLSPKIMTTEKFTEIAMGNHDVATKEAVSRIPITDIAIYHYPIRSYQQFERKVIDGGASCLNGPLANDPAICWHWREWYRVYNQGKLPALYNEIICLGKTIDLLKNGIIQEHRSMI